MVSEPFRVAPVVFPDAVKVTVPLPLPDAPVAIVSQVAFETAVQPHVAPAVTATLPPPPIAGTETLVGAMAYVQGTADWVTVKTVPAIVTVPVRVAPGFAVAVMVTVPLPVPLDALEMVSQSERLVAVHLQAPALASIVAARDPPAAGTVGFCAFTVNRHGAGSCAIGTCVSLTTSIALRGAGSAFAVTRYETDPLPCP
jgi:hypothetical protein